MLNYFINLKKGVFGTLLMLIIIPLSLLPFFNTGVRFGSFSFIDPIFFLPFLITPYLNKHSVIIGSFLGSLSYSLLINSNILLGLFFSIIFTASFFLYSIFFKSEPEKIQHYISNSIILVIVLTQISWLVSFIKAALGLGNFYSFLEGYYFFGGLISFILINYITIAYGVKLNSILYFLRK